MDLVEFSQQLESDVLSEAKSKVSGDTEGNVGEGEDYKENAFTRVVLQDLEDAGVLEAPHECHYRVPFKGQDAKVNAYDIPDDESRLILVVTDYRLPIGGEPGRLNSDDVERNYKMAERFLAYTVSTGGGGPDPSQPAFAMIYDISSRKSSFNSVQVVLITNCILAVKKEKQKPKQLHGYSVSYDVWDIERFRRFRASGASHEPIEVDLSRYPGGGLACLSNADPDLGYSTSIAVIPGRVLADWYEEYGARLLELNVRSYLQAKGKINKGILETLVKEPERFLAYNNGITIVAEEVSFTPDQQRIRGLRGLQIVNGGQTTASVHRARKENHADLSHVYVQAKITKVSESLFEEVVPQISRLSNTQNKVSEVDLRANHRFHVGIERAATRKWVPGEQSKWFYERARGSYQTERARVGKTKFDKMFPSAQRITKEDLAKYVNAFECLPHLVSRGGQKNFKPFMDNLPSLPPDWEPTDEEYRELIGKAILFRRTQEIAKSLGMAAFRINLVSYTVSIVSLKTEQLVDFANIWDRQGLTQALDQQIKIWLPKVADILNQSAAGKNPTEWFKLESCWLNLKDKASSWEVSKELGAELRSQEIIGATSATRANIAECRKLGKDEWFEIYKWCEQSSNMTRSQTNVARRMAELAMSDWNRDPTERQAADAVDIVRLFSATA